MGSVRVSVLVSSELIVLAGRTGLSSGIGPFRFYTSGGTRAPGSGVFTSLTSMREKRRAARLKEEKARLEKTRHLIEMFSARLNVHKQEFPPVTRPAAPSAQQATELLFVSAIVLRPLLVFLFSIATPVGSSSKRRMQLLQSLSPMKLCTARTSRS